MPSTLTQAWAARDALYALLVERAPTDGTKVWNGRPNYEHNFHSNIYVDRAETRQEWKGIGSTRREEDVTLTVVCEVFAGGGEENVARDGARLLANLIGDVVADPALTTLGGTVFHTRPEGAEEEQELFADGYLARVTLRLLSLARTNP